MKKDLKNAQEEIKRAFTKDDKSKKGRRKNMKSHLRDAGLNVKRAFSANSTSKI